MQDIVLALKHYLACPILTSQDADFENGRRVWNGMIDRHPLAIVRASSAAEVGIVIKLAREKSFAVTVRSGGHGISGKAVADDAVMIDLSGMRKISICPEMRLAIAQAGPAWNQFDQACEPYGLAVTGGVISSTGIAGLTLGGGMGYLMGKHGLACDNLVAAELVDANGNPCTINAETDPDLFWAIRGGGGNFGVVTSFTYRLHPLSNVFGGLLAYPRSLAFDLLRRYRDVTSAAPDELTAYAALVTGGGTPLAAISMCHSGDEPALAASQGRAFWLREPAFADHVDLKKYAAVQSMLDAMAPAGLHYYFKCPFVEELSDPLLRTLIECAAAAPTEQTQIVLEHLHGVASRIPVEATAFGLRKVHYSINIMPAWQTSQLTPRCLQWARQTADALMPFGTSAAYVNYLSDDDSSLVRASYGANFARLAQLKARYDPENFFRFNPNIQPLAA